MVDATGSGPPRERHGQVQPVVVLALVTHRLSQEVLQQNASAAQTLVAQVEQVLTSGPPLVHSLCAQPVPQAEAQAVSPWASVTHWLSHLLSQQKASLSQTALVQGLQVGLSALPTVQGVWSQVVVPPPEQPFGQSCSSTSRACTPRRRESRSSP